MQWTRTLTGFADAVERGVAGIGAAEMRGGRLCGDGCLTQEVLTIGGAVTGGTGEVVVGLGAHTGPWQRQTLCGRCLKQSHSFTDWTRPVGSNK